MTKIIKVEKKEDCNRLEECGVQCLALGGQPCPGPDHPDCPLDDEHLCDDCLELTHGDAIKTMTELKKENAEKDKKIEELKGDKKELGDLIDHHYKLKLLKAEQDKVNLEKQLEEEREAHKKTISIAKVTVDELNKHRKKEKEEKVNNMNDMLMWKKTAGKRQKIIDGLEQEKKALEEKRDHLEGQLKFFKNITEEGKKQIKALEEKVKELEKVMKEVHKALYHPHITVFTEYEHMIFDVIEKYNPLMAMTWRERIDRPENFCSECGGRCATSICGHCGKENKHFKSPDKPEEKEPKEPEDGEEE